MQIQKFKQVIRFRKITD